MQIHKEVIIVKLISGLGNQLFQYTFARLLSIKHQVPLLIDNSFFKGQELRNFKLNNYQIDASIATEEEIENFIAKYSFNKPVNYLYHRIEKYIPIGLKRFYKEQNWWIFDQNIYKLKTPFYIEGYWQNSNYYKNIPNILKTELKLKTLLSDQAQKVLNLIIADSVSVAIHIRRGDYVTDKTANEYMGVLPLAYYKKAIEFIKLKVRSPNFYIFSDDIDWAKENLSEQFTYVAGNKDFEDLELMKNCKHQIIANSSFSWWAAFLNENEQKTVICPKKWLFNTEVNNLVEIQMPNWIKI